MSKQGNTLYALTNQISQFSPQHLDVFASLTNDQFKIAFDSLLGKALAGMEKNKDHFQDLGETALSGVLMLAMSMPGLSVTQEEHSNGHADLTFEFYRFGIARSILGEAKIYDGPQYHIDGLNQLLGYMTGREFSGLMVAYVKTANVAVLMQKVRDTMDEMKPDAQRGTTQPHALKWAFNSTHLHPCGEPVAIDHVACNLF